MTLEVVIVAVVAGLAGGAVSALAVGVLQAWMARPRGRGVERFAVSAPTPGAAPPSGPTGMGPFGRFDDRAKRVLALAQDEAIRFNHSHIGTEHLLLGLVREGEGVGGQALRELRVDLAKVRTAVEFVIGRGQATTSPSEITLSPRTKKVIELAIDEARRLGHAHVGTEHLLLGLVREGQGMASGVLESLGVSLGQAEAKVHEILGGDAARGARSAAGSPGAFALMDDRTKRAVALAQDEAVRMGHGEIGGEHLLIGLARIVEIPVPDEPMRLVLERLGLTLARLREEVTRVSPPHHAAAKPHEITLSADARRAVERSVADAHTANRAAVLPEHLLLALSEVEGPTASILSTLDVTTERVRQAIAGPAS